LCWFILNTIVKLSLVLLERVFFGLLALQALSELRKCEQRISNVSNNFMALLWLQTPSHTSFMLYQSSICVVLVITYHIVQIHISYLVYIRHVAFVKLKYTLKAILYLTLSLAWIMICNVLIYVRKKEKWRQNDFNHRTCYRRNLTWWFRALIMWDNVLVCDGYFKFE